MDFIYWYSDQKMPKHNKMKGKLQEMPQKCFAIYVAIGDQISYSNRVMPLPNTLKSIK